MHKERGREIKRYEERGNKRRRGGGDTNRRQNKVSAKKAHAHRSDQKRMWIEDSEQQTAYITKQERYGTGDRRKEKGDRGQEVKETKETEDAW